MEKADNLNNVEVKSVANKGLGLFAKRKFRRGDKVLEWNEENKFLSEKEVEDLRDDEKKYVAVYNKRYLLIPKPERYMNHSCNPNTQVQEDGTDIALKDIEKGEEITGDYTKEGTFLGFECLCGSKECKHTIPSTRL